MLLYHLSHQNDSTFFSVSAFLTAVLKGIEGDVWIGLTNFAGVWSWADGTELLYENWAPGQPDSVRHFC